MCVFFPREVKFLLGIGANPNRIFNNCGGISPFHIAVGLEDDLKFAQLFLSYNADVNLRFDVNFNIRFVYVIIIMSPLF